MKVLSGASSIDAAAQAMAKALRIIMEEAIRETVRAHLHSALKGEQHATEEPRVASMPREALIRLPEVMRYTGLSKTEVYERMADRDFPQAVQLGLRAVAWYWGEVADWNMARQRVPARVVMRRKVG